jgi:asparagine synthase (glutamine-hydrolysing)
LGGEQIKTFSVGFEEDQFNELPMSRLVANKFGLESHEIIVRPDVLEVLPLLATQFDEPFGDPSAVPSFYVSQVAREHVKMCLSGDGGDELFAGYKRYAKALKFSWYDNCPSQLKKLAGLASRKMSWNVPGKDFLGRYIEGAGMVSDEFREELFQKKFRENYGLSGVEEEYRKRVAKCANSEPLTMMAYSDLRSYLPENNLTKVDRSSMLNSLEVRVPLIDLEVVDYALQIPPELLMQQGQTKSLLRKLASRYLPSEVVNAGKRGFAVPVDAWLRGELSATVEDTLGNPNGHIYEYLDFQTVSQVVRVHQDGRGEFGHILWALMMFEMWAREYL